MSEGNGNGHLKVDCPSTRTFEFPGGFLVPCDAIKVYSDYLDVRRPFAGEGDTVPRERMTELNDATVGFVRRLLNEYEALPANAGKKAPVMDAGHALRFVTLLAEENAKIADFFVTATPGRPSSRQSTELTFSTSEVN